MYYCPRCRTVITKEAQEQLFCANCGYHLPSIQLQPAPHPPYKSPGLIRPIGTSAQQKPATPADAALPDIHTPAHLLALSPNPPISSATPSDPTSPNIQAPLSNAHSPHQFMHPVFIAPKEGTFKATPFPDQQNMAPPGPNSSIGLEQVQIQSLQLSQLSQSSQSSQSFQHSNSLPEPPTLEPHSKQIPIEIVKGNPYTNDTRKSIDQPVEDEGFIATSAAAEHWRTSWRNRQRSEAGPAAAVSRGQSSVPEPLMAMQHSLQRMRAIINPQTKKEGTALGFWITLFSMICIIAIMGAYIASTYLPKVANTAYSSTAVATLQPTLMIQGTPIAAIAQGQSLHLSGVNFNAGAPIIFLLDSITAISGTDGREISILASNQGTFVVALPVSTVWSPGQHEIQAMDNKSGQSAYMSIQVDLPHPSTISHNVYLSTSQLTFEAVINLGNPREQFVKLTNSSSTASIQWTATVFADNNLTWLSVDESTTSGILKAGGAVTVGINASVAGLKGNVKPYTGHILFTLNQAEQLTLPVKLNMRDGKAEIVINSIS